MKRREVLKQIMAASIVGPAAAAAQGQQPGTAEEAAITPAEIAVVELSRLLKARKVTSTALTQMYLARLKRLGPRLHCVVTLTEELALEQAARADRELAAGHSRGPLHGIPWGAKDLLATRGIRT